ncbi:cell division protein SepF [Lutibacter sp. B2]|nr:cell division protein SepF [Lutibacter sp. B2]
MAGKFADKVKYFMGLDEYEEEDYEKQEEFQEPDPEMIPVNNKKNKVVNIHTNPQMKVVVYEPIDFEETPKIVDSLKNRKAVIINLEKLDPEVARKIFDFLNGAIYALDGNIKKVSQGIFVLAPNNVDIAGNAPNGVDNKGIFTW